LSLVLAFLIRKFLGIITAPSVKNQFFSILMKDFSECTDEAGGQSKLESDKIAGLALEESQRPKIFSRQQNLRAYYIRH